LRSLAFPRSVLAFAKAREQAALQIPDAWSQSKRLATIYLWISLSGHFSRERGPGKKPKELSIHSGVNSGDRVWSWLPLVLCGGTRGSRPDFDFARLHRSQTLRDSALGAVSSSESIETAAEFTALASLVSNFGRASLHSTCCETIS